MKVAAIDVGTNSTRLLVAEVSKDCKLQVIETDLKTTRLGEGIGVGYLTETAMMRTLQAIKLFANRAEQLSVERVLIAATSAVRDANNKEGFIDSVYRETGYPLSVLAGEIEAKMSYQGVLAGMKDATDGVVVIDVGGGSTEVSWQKNHEVHFASVNVGAVRMTEGNHCDEEIKTLLQPLLKEINQKQLSNLVAVGGTATTIAAMIQKLEIYQPEKIHGFVVTGEQLEEVLLKLKELSVEERKHIVGLQPERADIIPAGVNIIYQVITLLQAQYFTVSETDILWGLALEAATNVDKKNSIDY